MEFFMQKETNKNKSLNTNIEPAKAFIRPKKEVLLSYLRSPSPYYFHVTTFKNIPSIMENGLEPTHGGKNGASARVSYKDMIEISKGLVHVAKCISGTATYIDLYEKSGFSLGWYPDFPPATNLRDSAIVLRFSKKLQNINWKRDQDDLNGLTTTSKISSKYIEALTTEGWVPVTYLVEVKKAMRRSKRTKESEVCF